MLDLVSGQAAPAGTLAIYVQLAAYKGVGTCPGREAVTKKTARRQMERPSLPPFATVTAPHITVGLKGRKKGLC